MDFFPSLFKFYSENEYFDVSFVSGVDQVEVRAHTLVLAAGVPGLQSILSDQPFAEDITVLLTEITGSEIRQVVDDIYAALVQEEEVEEARLNRWSDFFSAQVQPVQKLFTKLPASTRRVATKRRLDDYEYDFPTATKTSRASKRKMPPEVVIKDGRRQPQKKNVLSTDSIKTEVASEVAVMSDDDDGLVSEEVTGNRRIIYAEKKELEQQDSSDDLSDLLRVETTDMDELSDSEDGDDEDEQLQRRRLQLNTDPLLTSEVTFTSLPELISSVCNPADEDKLFLASAEGYYLKDGLKPFLPLRRNTRVDRPKDVAVIPDSEFVGFFAVGPSDDGLKNLATPIAVHNVERFSTDLMCRNFISAIRHLTGVSTRAIIESHRHKSFQHLDKAGCLRLFEKKVAVMSKEEIDISMAENTDFQTSQDEVIPKIRQSKFLADKSQVKFKLVDSLSADTIADYVLIHGNSVDSLIFQSYLNPSAIRLTTVAAVSLLVDVLAAFCQLKSASSLYTDVAYFKELVDVNLNRICERQALSAASQKTKAASGKKQVQTKSKAAKSRTTNCSVCQTTFPFSTTDERASFMAHKASHDDANHDCGCQIEFASDADFRAHYKSVHVNLRAFKCTFGKCNRRFSRRRTLERHVNRVHSKSLEGGTGVVCHICGEAYLNQFFLQRHNYLNHKSRPCPGCKVMVHGGQAGMYRHRSKECSFTMDNLCPHCGQAFKMRVALNNHIRIVHLADKEGFACTLCPKKFANQQRLNVHMWGVHNKEKRFHCRAGDTVCTAKFSTMASRKRHEMKQHSLDIRLKRGGPKTSMIQSSTAAATTATPGAATASRTIVNSGGKSFNKIEIF